MSADTPIENPHRRVPSVDALLQQMPEETARWGHQQLTAALREILADIRTQISRGELPSTELNAIRNRVNAELADSNRASLKPVINLTGTVLHTNLGRASLPQEALDAVVAVSAAPSNLEFDLETGGRGDRETHIEALVCELTGAEAATAVNNNAAAVLLVLNTLAMHREVPVSRGELVEIGGSFRIPEVMQRANCTLVEIGATNRTHLKDYQNAINSNTSLLMKVHTSNYQVEGFTHAVPEAELAVLAHDHQLPLVIDLGSGSLVDFASLGLPAEPTAAQAIAQGADIITFSGDKLLGGPQAGLIAGRKDLIQQIKNNPLKRALRLDKMTLAALAAVLKLYRDPDSLLQRLPTLRQLTRPQAEIAAQAQRLLPALSAALSGRYAVTIADCCSQIGSGALPLETLPSTALRLTALSGADAEIRQLAETLRQLPRPVIGRLHQGALWLDLRCLEQESEFLEQLGGLTL
ncbi:MAG: L-seryl-tRNA(Sec) selenium transferase [Gammaproteobacteria bacterium]|nr:L-seryl-tRNA(Sec) selenium transferase [Gammaproteobacteria bacterium]